MDIEKRIDQLERNNRLHRRVGILAVGLLLAALAAWALWPAPKTIVAEKFILKDKEGMFQSTWGIDKEGIFFALESEDGKRGAILALTKKGTGLYVNSAKGRSRFFAGIAREMSSGKEAPEVLLRDQRGEPRAILFFGDGRPELLLIDSAGKHRASFALTPKGEPSIQLLDDKEMAIFKAPAESE